MPNFWEYYILSSENIIFYHRGDHIITLEDDLVIHGIPKNSKYKTNLAIAYVGLINAIVMKLAFFKNRSNDANNSFG